MRLLAPALAAQLVFGFALALLGTLFGLPAWTGALRLDLIAQGRLLLVFFTVQFACTAAAGEVVDRIGATVVLAGGIVAMGAGFALMAAAGGFGPAVAATALASLGGAAVNAASNTMVSVGAGPRRAPMLNLLAVFSPIGAVATPLVLTGGLDADGISVRLGGLALFALLLGWLPAVAGPRALPAAHPPSIAGTLGLLRDRYLLGLVALLLLDFGVEAVLAGWIGAYGRAVAGSSSGLLIGLYWGGLGAGRLVGPLVLRHVPKLSAVTVAAAAACVVTAAMVLAPRPAVLAPCALLAGLALATIGPTIVSVAGDRYPQRTGAVFGLLLALAQVGSMIFPWLVARVAVVTSLRAAMLLPAAGALGIALGAGATWRRRSAAARQRRIVEAG